MINGGHVVIYSTDPEADRAFFWDILKLTNVDVGNGWLIFGLPPSEIAVHPSDKNDVHEFFLMCEDIQDFVKRINQHGIECEEIINEGWGSLTRLVLPGGGKLGVYQPHHARPEPMS